MNNILVLSYIDSYTLPNTWEDVTFDSLVFQCLLAYVQLMLHMFYKIQDFLYYALKSYVPS